MTDHLCFYCDRHGACPVCNQFILLDGEIRGYTHKIKIIVEECDMFYTTNPHAPEEVKARSVQPEWVKRQST